MTLPDFEQSLGKLADVLVRIGLSVQPEQHVHIVSSIPQAPGVLELVRAIVDKAYAAGARHVNVRWTDPVMDKLQLKHQSGDALKEFSQWVVNAEQESVDNCAARLSLFWADADLLRDVDKESAAIVRRVNSEKLSPIFQQRLQKQIQWCVAALPVQSWADRVFPELDAEKRMDALWKMIFEICYIDQPDPVAAWEAQRDNTILKREHFTRKQYKALHFKGPGTDLRVGLPDNHLWEGGAQTAFNSALYTPNIPTEEVFTAPHRERVNGIIKASMPLNYGGTLIEDFSLTFENGKVTKVTAKQGEEVLSKMLDTDEGSRRLGEVALVPNSSPIAQIGRTFYNTLYDENAASHMALGSCYPTCFQNGTKLTQDELRAAGGNTSMIHTDFMVGSGEIDIDGITADGRAESIMRSGDWAIMDYE